jgi:hypothetical protein
MIWNPCRCIFLILLMDKVFISKKKIMWHTLLMNDYNYYHMLGPSWPWSYGSWIYNYLCNQCLSSLMLWVRISIGARCTTLCDKVCQWLAIGRWYSPISSTNKTDRHDIAAILLKVALNTIKQTISSPVKQLHMMNWFVFYWIFFPVSKNEYPHAFCVNVATTMVMYIFFYK